ncbi:MFS transporter [Schleiferilactobacillus shenzhenensis]|nr:MFS transporter [Schleiferilactobacillus shenzhenensis]
MTHIKHPGLMKFSLLAISLILTSNTAIAAALPMMLGYYKNMPQSSVELLMTIPQASVVVFIALSTIIAKKFGEKRTVLAGLVIGLVAGVLPFFTANYTAVLISRVLLGVGFGLINSLAVSMISEFFSGDTAATLIGFQSAFQGLGAAVLTFTAGQLLTTGWQHVFLVYLIMIPIILLFGFFVPEPPHNDAPAPATADDPTPSGKKTALNPIGVAYGLLALVLCVVYMIVSVKLSEFMTSTGLGTASQASTVMSVMQLANMAAGFVFGLLYKKLHAFTLPVALFATAAGFGLILIANNLFVVSIGAALNGISFALWISYIMNDATRRVDQAAKSSTTATILFLANIGNFVSPYGQRLLGAFGLGSNALHNVFINGALLSLILAVVFLLPALKRTRAYRTATSR